MNHSDFADYLHLVQTGQFYDSMMALTGSELNRQDFKSHFFARVFYCSNGHRTAEARLFRERFPTVHAVLSRIKDRDKRDAPLRLQRMEADFMIRTVCRRFLRAHPDVPILTVHDSLMTTRPHAGLVRDFLLAEFRKVGVSPTLRVTDYGPGRVPPG